jgi:hypothetical protein
LALLPAAWSALFLCCIVGGKLVELPLQPWFSIILVSGIEPTLQACYDDKPANVFPLISPDQAAARLLVEVTQAQNRSFVFFFSSILQPSCRTRKAKTQSNTSKPRCPQNMPAIHV